MRHCGYGSLARTLSGSLEALALDGPSFAMPGDQPRYAPDRPADIRHMDIVVTLDFERKRVSGSVTHHFSALFDELRAVTLDAAELSVEAVTLANSGAALDWWTEGEKLHIQLDRVYKHGEEFAVSVRYWAQPRIGLVFVGPDAGNPDMPVQAWTQGETEYHHFWFPCHDFPNDRATTTMAATVPGAFLALSNGKLERVEENKDGTKTYHWRQEVAFPAYLITLVAGEFVEIQDHWRDIPVNYYVRVGREDDARRMMGHTPAMMEFFTEHFGVDYPYAKYAQIVAEMFLGAMENVSATTHTYRLLADERASLDYTPEPVVAHELVHQWFGDLIAVRDWSHTWLKESFATYFEAVWMREVEGDDHLRFEMRENGEDYLAADKRGRRPIVYNVYRKNGNELFDPHNYQKGSRVLHMLRQVVGEDAFWRGMKLYTRRNQGREVITADFERAHEEASGRSLARFFEQWVYKAGHPEFTVSYSWDDERKMAKLTVKQTQKADEQTPLFETPVDLAFFVPRRDGEKPDASDKPMMPHIVRVVVDQPEQTFYIPLARRPFGVRFDYGGWLLKTLSFEQSAEAQRFLLRRDPDVNGRIEAAEALGERGDPQSLDALEKALFAEEFWGVRQAIAGALAKRKTARALDILLRAVKEIEEPKARRAIVAGLGEFRAPDQGELAAHAATALTDLLKKGEPSYFVTAAAATALGKTRAPGAFDTLLGYVDTPSWREIIREGVFAGLGETGDTRAAEVLASWAADRAKPMDARAAACAGLGALGSTKLVDSDAARTRAVEALMMAVSDPWEWAVLFATRALIPWGDMRAIPALERLVAETADERVARVGRTCVAALQKGDTVRDETRKLREDLDTLREENRKLRERLDALEAATPSGHNGKSDHNGAGDKPASATTRRATTRKRAE
ncbi:MAG TPA: M1 family aminopeptidase [Ktedonobacterales bacterium]|nr:M1 family aminopeptidase [Ktedonobacterales bacterium]